MLRRYLIVKMSQQQKRRELCWTPSRNSYVRLGYKPCIFSEQVASRHFTLLLLIKLLPVDCDEELILPISISRILLHQPLLKTAPLDSSLDAKDHMHQALLDDNNVDLFELFRYCWQDFCCIFVEMVMLLFCKLFPPLFAPWHGHLRQHQIFAFLEVAI